MSTPLRVGVIGVGHLGRHHARILGTMPGVQLVGVVDNSEARAEEIAAASNTAAFTEWQALEGKVDAVTVAVPTESHLDVALAFIERGVHVLVEKPLARTVEEADRLVNAAAVRGVTLAVGHTERFNPAVAEARRLLHGPRFIEAHRLGTFPERSLDIDVVFDLMIHDLDIVLSIVGEPTVSVEAVGVPVLTPRIDIANVRLRFAGGCIANLTASRISRDRIRKIRFFQPQAVPVGRLRGAGGRALDAGTARSGQSAAVDPGRQARGRQGRAAAPRTGRLRHRGARRPGPGRDRRAGPRSAAAGGGDHRADAAWSAMRAWTRWSRR